MSMEVSEGLKETPKKSFGIRVLRAFQFRLKKNYWVIKKRPWLVRSILSLFALILLGCGAGVYYLYYYDKDLVDSAGQPLDLNKLSNPDFKMASYVKDAKDNIIGKFFYDIREPVKYADVPDNVKNAFLAAEDKRFFSHHGYDRLALGRAFVENKIHHCTTSGASTITQQLARLLYDSELPEFHNREISIKRKLKEIRVAIQIERRYSKEQIFEAFLNYIYLGQGHYGVVEGARFYFSKDLQDLTVPEAALIAGLNKSPEKYSPLHHRKEALERRNWVLSKMADDGFISQEDYQQYLKLDLGLNLQKNDKRYGYGTDYVRRLLLSQNYSPDVIWETGGLKISTTIDPQIQHIVSDVLKDNLAEYAKTLKSASSKKLEGAIVAIDNETGAIVALSGGSDFSMTQLNRAVQTSTRRQPGSAFKPFTYVTALKKGMTIWDSICDCPIRLPNTIANNGAVTSWWTPRNFGGGMAGSVPMWNGLVKSRNLATLNLAIKVAGHKIGPIIETAHDMGIKSELQPYLPTAIGATDVTLLELTAAYTTFPNMGLYREPYLISEVQDSKGQVIYTNKSPQPRRAFDEDVAVSMMAMMRAVTKIGTAIVSMRDIQQQVAGKTGTTNDAKDVLFIGYTPRYTIGVRLGYDTPESIGTGQVGTGGRLAAPLFRKIIDKIYQNRAKENFPEAVETLLQDIIHGGPSKLPATEVVPIPEHSVLVPSAISDNNPKSTPKPIVPEVKIAEKKLKPEG